VGEAWIVQVSCGHLASWWAVEVKVKVKVLTRRIVDCKNC
jgi:hypothetical protein